MNLIIQKCDTLSFNTSNFKHKSDLASRYNEVSKSIKYMYISSCLRSYEIPRYIAMNVTVI